MIPNFTILGKTFSAYMIVATIGVLVLLFSMRRISRKKGMDELSVQNAILVSFIGVVVGSHLLCGIGNTILIIKNHIEITSFKEYIVNAFSGAIFYGGLFGALIASYIFVRIKKLKVGEYADIAAMSIPLFHFFGRIGCFLSGCCYGIESKIGFVYHYSIAPDANEVCRFPIQLVEAAFNICLFFVIYRFFQNDKYKNKLLYIYLISYAIARFIIEFFRGDEYRGYVGPLSLSQFISVLIIVTVFSFILIKKHRAKKEIKQA